MMKLKRFSDRKDDYIIIDTVGYMGDLLDKNNIIFDKVEIEECIYDTNILIDKNWLN